MQAFLILVVASLGAMVVGEAPSNAYGAPFRQPQFQPPAQQQRVQPKQKAQPKAQPQPQPQPQQSQQFQAFTQPQTQPLSFSPISSAGPFGRQFFIPAPEPARLSELYHLPNQYGPPLPSFTTSAPTTTEAATTTTEAPTTTEPAPADFGFGVRAAEESGVYYVLQPDGRLQRIAYAHGPVPAPASASAAAPERLSAGYAPSRQSALQQPALTPGYLARFQYQDLQPAGAPIYSYKQPELVRVN